MLNFSKQATEYFEICAYRLLHPLPKSEYGEKHHILPKACGGGNWKWNLVRLTPEEHYRCHRLLPSIFKFESYYYNKMVYALYFLCKMYSKDGRAIVSENEYAAIRKEGARVHRENQLGKKFSEETRRRMSEAQKKRTRGRYHKKHSLESRKKQGETIRKKWADPEFKKKMKEIFSHRKRPSKKASA